MPRKVKSQWDFGELFPTEPSRRVLTVTELTGHVRRLLEKEIGTIWVTGEITNLRAQSSGHIYFTLKDSGAQLNCVLFRGETVANREVLQDGQKVILNGALTVYEPRGQYQLRVVAIELQGVGALQLAFEKLKQKLQSEGLFDSARKRPLPRYPQRIGLVTSSTGAAIRDVLHVIERRQPGLELVLVPCRVQGQGAAEEIASSIRLLNEWSSETKNSQPIDLILVTRGGGSLEDLWAFNEEIVARTIFDSVIPIVSAVGHEIDFTISDFVADMRAATPSAAAEIITEGAFGSRSFVAEAASYMTRLSRRRIEHEQENLEQLTQRFVRAHPRRRLNEQLQFLDDLQTALVRCVRQGARDRRIAWQTVRQRLSRLKPSFLLPQHWQAMRELKRRLQERARHGWQQFQNTAATLEARLRLLSPENVLARGYSITMDAATGKIIRSARETRSGQKLKSRLRNGEVSSVVSPARG